MLKLFPLFSGGVDSTIALLKRLETKDFGYVEPIFFDYGQNAVEQEWKAVCNIYNKLPVAMGVPIAYLKAPTRINLRGNETVGIPIFGWSKAELMPWGVKDNFYVENRNMVLLSIAASFVESKVVEGETAEIVTGFRDEFDDTKKEYVQLINRVLHYLSSSSKKEIKVKIPIISYGAEGKPKMVAEFKQFKDILKLTWSCYTPTSEGKPCLHCVACLGRIKSFELLKS